VHPGPKDAFAPGNRGKLIFEDEPGKKPGKAVGIFTGSLFLFTMFVMIIAAFSGGFTNINSGNVLLLVVICGMMGFMGAMQIWATVMSDKFRIYSGGITFAMKRRLPDGRWSSFYPKESIKKIGYEQAGMLGMKVVLVISDQKRDGTVYEEKTELSGVSDQDGAEKALKDAFADKWEKASREYFDRQWSGRRAEKASDKRSNSALNWMLGLSWAAWILGMIPIFWPLFPEPKAVSLTIAGFIIAILGVPVARGLSFRHREYRKGLTKKARLASDGLEIPRTLHQRMFTDKPLVFPLGWVLRVTSVKPSGEEAPYTKVDFSFGESYDLSGELGPKLVAAVPLFPAGENVYENAVPDVLERPPGLRPGKVLGIAAIFVLTNAIIGGLVFNAGMDSLASGAILLMVLMVGFAIAPLFGILSAMMMSDALAVRRPGFFARDMRPMPDWGAFLDEESPEETALIRRVNLNAASVTIFLGILMLVPGIYSLPFVLNSPELLFGQFSFIYFMDMISFLIAGLVIPGGMIMAVTALRRRPWRMYDNGILDFHRFSGKGVFIPYDRFSMIRESVSFRYGRVYELFTGNENVIMFSANPRTRPRVELVRKRTGKPGFDPELLKVKAEDIEKNTRATMLMQLLALGVAALFSCLFAQLFIIGSYGDLLRLSITLFPMISAAALMFSLLIAYAPGPMRQRPRRFRARWSMPFFAVPVAVLLISVTITGGFSESKFYGIAADPEPGSSVPVPDRQENVTAELFDNMIVRSGEVKTMRNCNFTFQCKQARQYQLWVEKGGSLNAENCTFRRGTDYYEYFGIEFHGSVVLRDCRIIGLTHADNNYAGQGCLEIWDGPVEMYNCTMCYTVGTGLLIMDAEPLFENCTFSGCIDQFAASFRSRPAFHNCTFRHVGTAVAAWDRSRATLENCTIERAFDAAVLCENSEVVLRGCLIKDIRGPAFELHPPGSIEDRETTFINVTGRLIEGPGLAFFDAVCFGANIVLVVLCPAAVWSYIGKHEKAVPAGPDPDL